MNRRCVIVGCGRRLKAHGLCTRHYQQFRGSDYYTARLPERDIPAVCVCDKPMPSAIDECQQCFRPYRQETFAECRAAWREHLGLSSRRATAAATAGPGDTPLVARPPARPAATPHR